MCHTLLCCYNNNFPGFIDRHLLASILNYYLLCCCCCTAYFFQFVGNLIINGILFILSASFNIFPLQQQDFVIFSLRVLLLFFNTLGWHLSFDFMFWLALGWLLICAALLLVSACGVFVRCAPCSAFGSAQCDTACL